MEKKSGRIIFSENEKEYIKDCYVSKKMSMLKIAKEFCVTKEVIKRVLKENSVKIRDNKEYRSKAIDELYFKVIDTEEKAYILGFIYADGCVTRNDSVFSIKLKDEDGYILEKMKEEFMSEHKIIHSTNTNGFSNECRYAMLSVNNKKFVSYLIDKGVYANKSKILKFPNNDQVPSDLIRHFIRGYLDGDGSVYVTHNKFGSAMLGMSFTGTYNMLENIKKYIFEITGSNASIRKYENKDVYDLKFGGNILMEKIYHYLYDGSSIYLERKHNVFLSVLEPQGENICKN